MKAGLPRELAGVTNILNTLEGRVRQASVSAEIRLGAATSDAERSQIRAQTLADVDSAFNDAADATRKAINLIRAEDPELVGV